MATLNPFHMIRDGERREIDRDLALSLCAVPALMRAAMRSDLNRFDADAALGVFWRAGGRDGAAN